MSNKRSILIVVAIALCTIFLIKRALYIELPLIISALLKASPVFIMSVASGLLSDAKFGSIAYGISRGLFLSAFGDLALEVKSSSLAFIIGLVFFLIGHLYYCTAFKAPTIS